MNRVDFLVTFGYFLLFVISATLTGSFVRKVFGNKENSIQGWGANLLIGMGVLSYIALFFGLLGLFTNKTILLILLIPILLSIGSISNLVHSIGAQIRKLRPIPLSKIIPFVSITFALIMLAALYLSAMRPPSASDELHYHFPQVRQIVESKRVGLSFENGPYYGNIPKQMEIIFAMGASLNNYSLSHALNLMIFVGFLAIVFGLINKRFGLKAAAFSVLLLVMFDDLTWNATVGFIDTAGIAMEIGSLLFFLEWYRSKSFASLLTAGSLLGLAFAIKYTPAPTAIFIAALILISIISTGKKVDNNLIKFSIYFFLAALLFGGYWYVKNLVLFGNPFYPFYLGHRGISDFEYAGILQDVRKFQPKTLPGFMSLIGYFQTINGATTYLSFFAAPLVLFLRKGTKNKKMLVILLLYVLFYFLYWFFLATHQVRFFASALVITIILTSIILSKIGERIIITLALIALFLLSLNQTYWRSFWNQKLHITESRYALGKINEREFLSEEFGCQYSVIKYLEDNNLKGGVIDNWSIWFDPSVSFYARKNNFEGYIPKVNLKLADVGNDLKSKDIKYLYFNSITKNEFLQSTDPSVIENKNEKLPAETYLLSHSSLAYQTGACSLYQIGF